MATTVLLNQTISKNPDQSAGGDFGVIVGQRPTQTLGFYGKEGIVQPAAPADFAALLVILQDMGLVAAS
jgi:hypothetical protein